MLIEKFVGKGKYIYGPYGKPSKEGKARFSLSHSGSHCLLAVAEKDVGADIEIIGGRKKELVEYCFDEEERAHIKNPEDFFLAWCEKEALGKCVGFGIKEPKKTPVHRLSEDKVAFEGEEFFVKKGTVGGYAYAIAAKEELEIEFIRALPKDLNTNKYVVVN